MKSYCSQFPITFTTFNDLRRHRRDRQFHGTKHDNFDTSRTSALHFTLGKWSNFVVAHAGIGAAAVVLLLLLLLTADDKKFSCICVCVCCVLLRRVTNSKCGRAAIEPKCVGIEMKLTSLLLMASIFHWSYCTSTERNLV